MPAELVDRIAGLKYVPVPNILLPFILTSSSQFECSYASIFSLNLFGTCRLLLASSLHSFVHCQRGLKHPRSFKRNAIPFAVAQGVTSTVTRVIWLCRHGGAYKNMKTLLRHKLTHHDSSKCMFSIHSEDCNCVLKSTIKFQRTFITAILMAMVLCASQS